MGRKGKIVLILFLVFPLWYIAMKTYWFAFCHIPSDSMYPALQKGDYIIASLQVPGRRIYYKNNDGTLSVKRKKGYRCIKKGDIVIFNYPYTTSEEKMSFDSQTYYCKRCSATPGEIYRWGLGNSDSVYLPKCNDVVRIDSSNYRHYKKCIEYETGKKIAIRSGKALLGDSLIQDYCFLKNYYFLCGDNQNISYDSRLWGILPEDFILGTAMFIYFSKDPNTNEVHWNRIFTKLNYK
ncbi:signal peptidase I [Parabacteroides goldsteinii]|uniref:signal peptidase I n=1 Tax=Parabacteroides goldsteinii TaxID=328812 RepID=UPI00241F2437|nr:signal peptidase I [Parabacteroides goldsteinii]